MSNSRKRTSLVSIFLLSLFAAFIFGSQPAMASYEINLAIGWNLVSLPEQPTNTDIAEVTSSIHGKYKSIWAYVNGSWKVYDPNNPGFSDLTSMEAGKGYWFNMSEDSTLSGSGSTPSSSISLNAGWNLIGFNNNTSVAIADALQSISGKYASIWAYIDKSWRVYDPNNPGFSDLTTIDPGIGYWISATESCQWVLAGAVYITTPDEPWITTTSSTYNVKGKSTGGLPVTWENSAGGSGTATGIQDWETGNINLSPEDNIITVSGGGSYSTKVVITYNPTVDFQSAPTFSQNSIESAQPATIFFTIAIAEDGLDNNTVALHQSDAGGAKGDKLGDMKDDGDFNGASGDDVQGDNVYTLKITVNEGNDNVLYFRVYAKDDTIGTEYPSPVGEIFVVSKPPQVDVDNAETNAADISNMWDSLMPVANSKMMTKAQYLQAFEDKQKQLAEYIEGLSNGLFAFTGTNGVFFATTDSPFIMVQETIPDLTAYEKEIDDGGERGLPPTINPTRMPVFFQSESKSGINILVEEDEKNIIKDKRAIFIDPYYWQHVNSTAMTDANGGWTKIKAAKCPDLEETEVLNGTSTSPNTDPKTTDTAIVDAFTTLSNYGTVVIHTHGAFWEFDSVSNTWIAELEAKINALAEGTTKTSLTTWLQDLKKNVISWTGKQLLYSSDVFLKADASTDFDLIINHKYWMDFMLGQLYLTTTGKILIPPSFISAHNGKFPNTVIWSGACHSLEDESMSSVFLKKGAGAYFGFDDSVYRSWNVSRAGVVFEKMLSEGKTAKEAFDAAIAGGNDDGHGTALVLKGNNDLKYTSSLQNPSFENPEGTGSLQSWTVEGDGRAWHAFQADSPTEGNTMAVVSSGLGHTTSYGSIEQNFCLPANAKTLKFDWNFYSAEFKDYCGSAYDDTFQVLINDTEMFKTSVNILCADSDALIPTADIDDKGDCFKTGWKSASVDISAYAGEDVTLVFKVLDKQDTIYDTAVLIDNIVIEKE